MSNKNSNNPLECSSGRAQKRSLYVKGCQRPVHWQSEKYTKKKDQKYLSKWAKKKKRREEKISKGEFFGNKDNRNIKSFKGYKKATIEGEWEPWYLSKYNNNPSCWYNKHTNQRIYSEPINKKYKVNKLVSLYK